MNVYRAQVGGVACCTLKGVQHHTLPLRNSKTTPATLATANERKEEMIKGRDPQIMEKLQTLTGWTRAKVRRFLRQCDEAKTSERDEIIRAIEAGQ